MTQEQRKRVEDALVSMIENVPSMNIGDGKEPKTVSADCMKAAAAVTYALIALQESEATLWGGIEIPPESE